MLNQVGELQILSNPAPALPAAVARTASCRVRRRPGLIPQHRVATYHPVQQRPGKGALLICCPATPEHSQSASDGGPKHYLTHPIVRRPFSPLSADVHEHTNG